MCVPNFSTLTRNLQEVLILFFTGYVKKLFSSIIVNTKTNVKCRFKIKWQRRHLEGCILSSQAFYGKKQLIFIIKWAYKWFCLHKNVISRHPVTLKLMTIIWWACKTYAIFIHWCKTHLSHCYSYSPPPHLLMRSCKYTKYIYNTHLIQTNLMCCSVNYSYGTRLPGNHSTHSRFLLRYNVPVKIIEHIPWYTKYV